MDRLSPIVAGFLAVAGPAALWLARGTEPPVVPSPLEAPPRAAPPVGGGPMGEVPERAGELSEGEGEADPALPVGTVDLPEQLDRRALEEGMARARAQAERCRGLEPFAGIVRVKLVIAKTGGVQSVSLSSPAVASQTTACVLRAARSASFPAFRGTTAPTIELSYPFYFPPSPGAAVEEPSE